MDTRLEYGVVQTRPGYCDIPRGWWSGQSCRQSSLDQQVRLSALVVRSRIWKNGYLQFVSLKELVKLKSKVRPARCPLCQERLRCTKYPIIVALSLIYPHAAPQQYFNIPRLNLNTTKHHYCTALPPPVYTRAHHFQPLALKG